MDKYPVIHFYYILAITLFAFLLTGCSIHDTNTSAVQELTDEELEVAGQIIAESLSDQKDGIFTSLNDAFTLPSENRFSENNPGKSNYSSTLFNSVSASDESDIESNYSYSYDPDTGIHLVSFNRSLNRQNFLKESSAELEYIYYDTKGSFISSPRLENDRIETIDFMGNRTGSITTPQKNSSYQRNDQFFINGLTSVAEVLTIEGLHEGSGQYKVTRENGDVIERNYSLSVEFLDVRIDNELVNTNKSLQKGVTGALAYEMIITRAVNDNESMKTVNGTIEFNGDGTALLRFKNILEDFKIKLEEGDLLEADEFEGFVRSADIENKSFTLYDDQVLTFDEDSEIDSSGDLHTLEDVQAVAESGIRVKAEGTFIADAGGMNIIRTVKFELEGDDLEFEDKVREVNIEENYFVLEDGTVLFINDKSILDNSGDLYSLEEVAAALNKGLSVKAEGKFKPETDGTYTVVSVKFESDNKDNEKEKEFEGNVLSANPVSQSFILAGGLKLFVTSDTDFDDGEINSMEKLADALTKGSEVKVKGEYYTDNEGKNIAIEIEFEIE